MTDSLVDWTPLVRMMVLGVVLALGPLAWVWVRNRRLKPGVRLRALTLLTLFLTFDLILFGAFTRLTDSGLGCPDWPGCYGNSSPLGAHAEISQAQAEMPTGPVTHQKAWIEMIHRYLATAVGVLILSLCGLAWWARRKGQVHSTAYPWLATFTLIWVCLQGAFGALTVTMKLFPAIVTLHLLGGLGLLALLAAQLAMLPAGGAAPVGVLQDRRLWVWAWLGLAVLVLQVALGGWVSTNYAVLACQQFPMCQGRWWPEMDFRQGFELWRELGMTAAGDHLPFAALTAIHMTHRLAALVVFLVLGALAWHLRKFPGGRRPSLWLVGLLVLQGLTGLSNVVLGWPLLAAVMHTGGAAALVWVLVQILMAGRSPSHMQSWGCGPVSVSR